MQLMLEREGFQVLAGEHGQAAIEQVEAHGEPDVALVDLMMPVMNGRDFLLGSRERGWTFPSILVSASPEAGELCARMGLDYIAKPYDFQVLLDAIERVLEKRPAA